MLVIARKLGETVQIDGGIEVKVLEISRNKVRLGFAVPADVTVLRGEVEDRRVQKQEPTA